MRKLLFAAFACAAIPTAASAAELIVNGGFEDPTIVNPCCNTVPPDSLPGWTVNFGNVNVVNGTFASSPSGTNLAFEGNQYLDLVGQGGIGSISQTFSTVAGQGYTLTFAYSHNLFSGLPLASALFSVDGLTGPLVHTGGSNADLNWQIFSGSFVADDATATLSFTNLVGGPNEGIFLDAVSVTPVPELATWALLLIGFGAVGGAMRAGKRRQRLSASHA